MIFEPLAQTTWYNELGSKMILEVGSDYSISGTYYSAVGTSPGPEVLSGRLNSAVPETIGWSVAWSKVNAVTSWSGQVIIIDNIPTILTTWLLTSQTPETSEWESTLIDQDVFTQNKPSEAQIAAARLRRGMSSPS